MYLDSTVRYDKLELYQYWYNGIRNIKAVTDMRKLTKVQEEIFMSKAMQNMKWKYGENGSFSLYMDEVLIMSAHARGYHVDGRVIDTKSASLVNMKESEKELILTFAADNGLCLTEYLYVDEKQIPGACCSLSGQTGEIVHTNKLVPLVVGSGQDNTLGIWKSIWSKMLLVPYDNTMWLRYEAVPLRAGRRSYDMTVMFKEDTREGLLIGAADFDVWKNGVICSATDAKNLCAQSGIADEGTHDSQPHGVVSGKEVKSAGFYVLYGSDYRELLEQYGDLVSEKQNILKWKDGVPFGFNSWAGLAFRLNADNYQKTGEFLRKELQPNHYENQGVTYANLDSGWNVIPEKTLTALVKELHENSQKAGIYDAPFAFFGRDEDMKNEIEGAPGHIYEEILMRDEMGRLLPRVDGAIPFDVTHPVWKQQMKHKLDHFLKWDFDYVKLDFMTHGGMEGVHFDKKITTGRQAINEGYRFISEYLAKDRIGKSFFISLSIAPMFPCGYGHARRFSCDAFGTYEDVEYVLNAQTYAWWENGRLYQFNDPDHICLLKSFCMDNESSEGEARARYTSAVIAGTVMMLSDDYECEKARERAKRFATNQQINVIAASQKSFRPVEAGDSSACQAFCAVVNDRQCIALFNWKPGKQKVTLDLERAGLKAGMRYQELWSKKEMTDKNGVISWEAEGCDAVLLQEI